MTFSTSSLKAEDPNLDPGNFDVVFKPPIRLDTRQYKISFYSFFGWNSFHNVQSKSISYTINGSPFTLNIPDGQYSIEDINSLLQLDIASNSGATGGIVITPNYNTNRTEITIDNSTDTFTIDLSAANNLANFFGFPEANVTGSSTGTTLANVNRDTENLNVETDLIKGSIKDGRFSRIIHSFQPAGPTNSSLQIYPLHQTWHQIDKKLIDRVNFKITDNNGEIVDFQGEDLTLQIILEAI